MSIYDATMPHKIIVPSAFSKLIISIPKPLIDSQLQHVEDLTAVKLASYEHASFTVSQLIKLTNNLQQFNSTSFQALSKPIVELIQSNLIAHGASQRTITRYKAISLLRVKNFILTELDDESLDAQKIAEHVRLSIRYINELFQSENTSVMRFVTEKRLERSRQYLANQSYSQCSITEIALRCGFKNTSHFSRIFKQSYDYSPRLFRQQYMK
jgi:AraC-like DNA-binding protein